MKRVMVAGVGNVLFGDDGFGVEVVRQLDGTLPIEIRIADFGIGTLHLAYELLVKLDLLIVVDCTSRGGAPGTLYVIEPELDATAPILPEAHGMSLPTVFAAVRELGGVLPPTLVVGCEPETLEPGAGLSPRVTRALPEAVALIRELISTRMAA
jgi:hydrogenase maturation protease